MAKKIIWSKSAHIDRFLILDYWFQRNNSKDYSKYLNKSFERAIDLISLYPYIGICTNMPNIRIKIVGKYYITYEIKDSSVVILRIIDTRREKL